MSYSSIAGGETLFFLALFVVILLLEAPLVWLKNRGCPLGIFPKQKEFWLLAAATLIFSVVVFAHFAFASGLFNKVGLVIEESPSVIGSHEQALILASGLCGFWFLVLLLGWKTSKKPINYWQTPFCVAWLYLVGIVTMAYLRSQTAAAITAGL